MNINQLSEIIKKKLSVYEFIKRVNIEDKSFLHKNHKTNEKGKFHIKLKIESEKLKNKNKLDSNRFIYKILQAELKNYIHSLQIDLY
tara:strand:- start:508 stop:768 length:261 start_codon:yes stop_codon:yes gene_type:complete